MVDACAVTLDNGRVALCSTSSRKTMLYDSRTGTFADQAAFPSLAVGASCFAAKDSSDQSTIFVAGGG